MIATGTRLKVTVEQDTDCDGPLEWDGQWTFYSFNRRHTHFKHPDDLDTKEMHEKLRRGLAWFLSCYEHGGIQWWIKGDAGHPSCPFDTTGTAGMVVWENDPDDMANPKRGKIASRKADAKSFVDVWNAWTNGECYWYSIEDEEGNQLDSCGGFIGDDGLKCMLDDVKSAVGDADVTFTGDSAELLSDKWPVRAVLGATD